MNETAKKLLVFVFILIVSTILGALYGIAHDQLTFILSPEFYTKFMFYQFGLWDEAAHGDLGPLVTSVGIMSTWWMGLLIGGVLALIGLIHHNWSSMLKHTISAVFLSIFVAVIIGLLGLLYGFIMFPRIPIEQVVANMPEGVIDVSNFYIVSCMHNFSYAGGIIGLVAGAIYSYRQKETKTTL